MNDLLKLRKAVKSKKPHFVMQDAHKKKKLARRWRKPKGIDSKMRLGLKGYRKCIEIGYGSPKEVKGLDRTGLRIIHVHSIKDMENIDKKNEGALICKIGLKKRVLLVKKAKEMGIAVLNIKDVDAFIKDYESRMEKKKEEKEKARKEKMEKKKLKEKKAEEKEKKKEEEKKEKSEKEKEEEKETENKEIEKILTKKDST